MKPNRVKPIQKGRVKSPAMKADKLTQLIKTTMPQQPRFTEAGALRDYIKIKAAQMNQNAAALRNLISKSSLTIEEARPFYSLCEKIEKEAIHER